MNLKTLLLATAAAAALLAPAAKAQVFSFGIGKPGKFAAYVNFGHPQPPPRAWVPGHYETVKQQVWVPGCSHREYVQPCWETRYDCWHRPYTVMVRPGYWKTIQDPGHYELRAVQVWIGGHWQTCP